MGKNAYIRIFIEIFVRLERLQSPKLWNGVLRISAQNLSSPRWKMTTKDSYLCQHISLMTLYICKVSFKNSKRVEESFVGLWGVPSVQEAKHAVAIVALHNFCSHLNLAKVIHPAYQFRKKKE